MKLFSLRFNKNLCKKTPMIINFVLSWPWKMQKKRIELLDNSHKKCVIEEYKEWINDGLNKHTVLLLRDDPII